MKDERYVDCEVCGERYVGEDAIKSYIRDDDVCISCLDKPKKRCRRCGSEATLFREFDRDVAHCSACYDGAPDSVSRYEYGFGRTQDEALKQWLESQEELEVH